MSAKIGPRYTDKQREALKWARREVRLATREIAEGGPLTAQLIAYRAAVQQRIRDIERAARQMKAQGN